MLSKPNTVKNSLNRFAIQEKQYNFPYHYIPHFDDNGFAVRFRALSWGFEYLCYLSRIREIIHSLTPSSVLEVGCGDGRVIGMLDSRIDRRMGVDIADRAIGFAKAFHSDIEFLAVDPNCLKETFDAVLAIEVLEHVPDGQIGPFLETLGDRTKNDGHVVVSVPTTVVPVSKKHYRHYNLTLFQEQLERSGARLDIVHIEYVCRISWVMNLYSKFTQNSYWIIEWRALSRLMWTYMWKRLRKTDEKHGQHLIVVLKKKLGGV